MKQNIPSQLATITRRVVMQLSITGVTGLSLLTASVVAQEVAPGFTPGSTANQPFELLKEAVPTWVPPATEVAPSLPDWAPPTTPAEVPSVNVPDLSQRALNSFDSDVIQPPVDVEFDVLQPDFNEPLQAPVQPPAAIDQNATFGTFGVPVIPEVPESLGVPQPAIETLSPAQPLGFDSDLGPSVITNEFVSPQTSAAFAGAQGIEGFPEANLRTPVRNILSGVNTRLTPTDESVHAVGQLTLLSLSRDYRGRGRTLSSGVPNLLANGPDEGDFTGVDLSYGRRRGGGQGWEIRYLGFNPDQATDISASSPTLVYGGLAPPLNDPATFGGIIPIGIPETFGLSGIGFPGLSVADIFNDSSNHRVSRDSEFGSFEFNLLRASAGGHRLSAGSALVEFFAGLRGVSFQETTVFTGAGTQTVGFPTSAFYSSEVENSLFGLQIGGRLERPRQNGWSTSFGTRIGIYNNRIESRQSAQIQFDDGSTAVPQLLFGDDAGTPFDFTDTDNELAFLGELDFGVIYHFRPQTRARFGYRGIAVTNIADSAGQLEDSLFDIGEVSEPTAFGDLIVGGFYFGVDHAF